MKTNLFLPIGLALAVSAATLSAQGGPGRYGRGGPPGTTPRGGAGQLAPPLAAILDTDNDGVLSAKEIAAAPDALKKLDRNNDGKLDLDELCPGGFGRAGRGRGGAAAGARTLMLRLFDTDNDGTVSEKERENAAAALRVLDRNNDGQLTANELRLFRGGGGPPWRQ